MGVNEYISIGNSDDKLTQAEWSRFVAEVRDLLQQHGTLQIHGEWFANPDAQWQNANWCVEILPPPWWRSAVERVGPDGKNDPRQSARSRHLRGQDMERVRRQLKDAVRAICYRWRQDTCAWTTGTVEFIPSGWTERRAYMKSPERAVVVEYKHPAEATVQEQLARMGISVDADGNTKVVRGGVQYTIRDEGVSGAPLVVTPETLGGIPQSPLGYWHQTEARPGEIPQNPTWPPLLVDRSRTYLNEEDRQRIHDVLERNRRDQASTLGEEPASDPRRPASIGGGRPTPSKAGRMTRQRAVHEEKHWRGWGFEECEHADCVAVRRLPDDKEES